MYADQCPTSFSLSCLYYRRSSYLSYRNRLHDKLKLVGHWGRSLRRGFHIK
jgi:hypothetical protein